MHHGFVDYDMEEIDTRGYRSSRETRKGSGQQTRRSGAVSLCSFCRIAHFERGCREVCPLLFWKVVLAAEWERGCERRRERTAVAHTDGTGSDAVDSTPLSGEHSMGSGRGFFKMSFTGGAVI